VKIKVSNYKCFGPEPEGFDELRPVNLIIGRNNSGKSSLADILKFAIEGFGNLAPHLYHNANSPELHLTEPLTEKQVRGVFPENTSGTGIPGRNFWEFGKQWVDKQLSWTIPLKGEPRFIGLEPPLDAVKLERAKFEAALVGQKTNPPLAGRLFRRLQAERHIRPESDSNPPNLQPNGQGATNTIQQFLNNATLPRKLVGRILLDELNRTFGSDGQFTNIYARRFPTNEWEIFLEESSKDIIALSQSGSGLQTFLLVLAYLYLLPHIESTSRKNYVFAFEELENNLHPAAQRRLLAYLREIAIKDGCTFILTTHSSVAIDLFSRDADAQIIHVTNDGTVGRARRVQTYIEHRGILDDLDVRASDLLQANGVIWVEGPSDRIYINRWIDLWSNGVLKEGLHYQIVFYGGRLLAHLSASDPEEISALVSILRVNRNAAIVIDSDKASSADSINPTKARLEREIEEIGGYAWVTAGREIENYITFDVLARKYGVPAASISANEFTPVADTLNQILAGEGNRFVRNKPKFAEEVAPLLTRDSISKTTDIPHRVDALCGYIRRWNGLA